MDSFTCTPQHPLLRCAAGLSEVLDSAVGANPVYLSVPEKEVALCELSRAAERVTGLLLAVLATADDVAAEHGARSPASWLAHRTRADRGPTAKLGQLADALESRWHLVAEALVEGRLSVPQAHAIVDGLEALPAEVPRQVFVKAEAHLVAEAAHFAPRQLRVLALKVLEVVAPDTFDDAEREALERRERAARRATSLSMRTNGDGTTDIRIRLPDSVADRLKVYLEAFSSPRREPGRDDASVERVPYPRRLGDAFCALLESLPSEMLPIHGGTATTLIVTIPLDHLISGLGVAQLSTGGRITAGEARRLGCNAGMLPAVLGGRSETLDLGRMRRLFSPAQRKAMAVRDRQCRVDGCDVPPAWCEAHHLQPWAKGGKTDLADGKLLCSFHHHCAHDERYELEHLANGDVRFHRRR
jgi:hypothetical protein